MQTEAQIRADRKYKKEHVKQIVLHFYPADTELYDWCKAQGTPALKEILAREKGAN